MPTRQPPEFRNAPWAPGGIPQPIEAWTAHLRRRIEWQMALLNADLLTIGAYAARDLHWLAIDTGRRLCYLHLRRREHDGIT